MAAATAEPQEEGIEQLADGPLPAGSLGHQVDPLANLFLGVGRRGT